MPHSMSCPSEFSWGERGEYRVGMFSLLSSYHPWDKSAQHYLLLSSFRKFCVIVGNNVDDRANDDMSDHKGKFLQNPNCHRYVFSL